MFDIGFWELLVIGVVLLLVMGPERLPEVAKQVAFFIRKARQGVYRLRSEMQDEISGTPFADIEAAKREMADFKNDIKQFGRDLADSAEEKVGLGSTAEVNMNALDSETEIENAVNENASKPQAKPAHAANEGLTNKKAGNKAKKEDSKADSKSRAKKKSKPKKSKSKPE